MKPHTSVEVIERPPCDICADDAMYDAKIPGTGWANLCQRHFDMFGCSLGLGKGQKLILKVDKDADKSM